MRTSFTRKAPARIRAGLIAAVTPATVASTLCATR